MLRSSDAIHSIFDVYPAIPKAIRLGEIEATYEADAIEKAAKEFQQDPTMLIVARRPGFPIFSRGERIRRAADGA
jgi:hypothetical protein